MMSRVLQRIVLLVFVISLFSIAELMGQITGDRRHTQQAPMSQLDISGTTGTFYYLDQLGLSLGLAGLPFGDVINPETYKLAPGDLVTITLSGNVNGVFRGLIVNQQGELVIPNIGSVNVNKMLLHEAGNEVREAVSKVFRDTDSAVSLERPRMIKVNIAGDVPNPGAYWVPAQTRLNMALRNGFFRTQVLPDGTVTPPPGFNRNFLMNGGFSLRNIRIKKVNEDSFNADFISYTIGGNQSGNPVVEHGDVIYVYEKQNYAPQVSVSGAVVSPLLIEYRADDSVAGLIDLAGGLAHDADEDDIYIVRRNRDGSVTNEPVRAGDLMTPLRPNDRIVVGFDRNARHNQSAWVHGEAVKPGNFPIVEGETTALELLELAGGLTGSALSHGAYLIRPEPVSGVFDGEPVEQAQRRQMLNRLLPTSSGLFDFEELADGGMSGDNPAFNVEQLKRASDQLMEGFDYMNLEAMLNQNQVFIDLNNPDQLAGIKLYGGDELYIPRDDNTVFLLGQVNNPGYFTYESGFSVMDYVNRAGGFTLAAENNRVFVIKAGSKTWYKAQETTVQSGDIIFVDRKPFDTLAGLRQDEFQRRELRNRNIQLILSGIATVASVITAYIAITR